MNEINDSDKAEKKAKTMRMLRYIWMFLISLFGILLLLNLYNWKYNGDSLTVIFTPLTFIFLGLASIVDKEKKVLHYVFLSIAAFWLLLGLTLLIMR
jgi:polyferredoxin